LGLEKIIPEKQKAGSEEPAFLVHSMWFIEFVI